MQRLVKKKTLSLEIHFQITSKNRDQSKNNKIIIYDFCEKICLNVWDECYSLTATVTRTISYIVKTYYIRGK